MSVITTQRLNLRELDSRDAAFIVELLNEEDFVRYIGDKGVRTLADANDYIVKGPQQSYSKNGFGLYAVDLPDGTPIGMCGLVKRDGLDAPDVGFAFLARYASNGFAVESARAVLEHAAKELKLNRVVAITSVDNAKSISVLEKIGLKFERKIQLLERGPLLNLFGTPP